MRPRYGPNFALIAMTAQAHTARHLKNANTIASIRQGKIDNGAGASTRVPSVSIVVETIGT